MSGALIGGAVVRRRFMEDQEAQLRAVELLVSHVSKQKEAAGVNGGDDDVKEIRDDHADNCSIPERR